MALFTIDLLVHSGKRIFGFVMVKMIHVLHGTERFLIVALQTVQDVLIEKLGPVEANRFLTLPKKKRLESVKRHQLWQSQLKKDDFFDKIFNE